MEHLKNRISTCIMLRKQVAGFTVLLLNAFIRTGAMTGSQASEMNKTVFLKFSLPFGALNSTGSLMNLSRQWNFRLLITPWSMGWIRNIQLVKHIAKQICVIVEAFIYLRAFIKQTQTLAVFKKPFFPAMTPGFRHKIFIRSVPVFIRSVC